MNLLLVGTSHRRAPVEVRERVALDADRAAELGAQLAAETGGEAVLLSTCNRTEIYLSAPEAASADRRATELLEELAGTKLEPYLYRLEDEAAAVHLFRVAAGLDSLVPGEGEILGQVRTAYERGTVGPLLDRVFNLALHTGKKVRTDTSIAESPGTTSSAAAALAAQVFGDLDGSRIAIVGAGKIGTRAARRLIKRGATLSFVANRTDARGRALAGELGGETIPLERVTDALASCDIVVSSTSSPELVLTKDDVAGVLGARKGRPLLLIDLAVPRDLDPAINEFGDCFLYDIDDLQAVVEETTRGREAEFAKAEAIAVAEGEKFSAWLSTRDAAPVIASLRQRAEEIRRSELAKASGRLAGLSEGERSAVESLTTQIVNKLLHEPIVRLKEAAAEEQRGPESRVEG
ncbi:MAG TPA: glutamyl-tRNA reductase [Gaiellaceae bacterium]|jgi:glutamyl-tRNA reductase|nr:glutamyl-tRNA reductase [Gaiellaceae bacterium]